MSKIEIVSTFEHQVWNMRRWFSLNAESIMLFTGFLLVMWAVFSIDIPLIPKVLFCYSDEIIEG